MVSGRQGACRHRSLGYRRSRSVVGISRLRSGRRSRAPSRSGLLHAGGRSPARASGIDNLRRACGATPPPEAAASAYRALLTAAQWHAERAARRPKQAKLARNAAIKNSMSRNWLAGVVVAVRAGLLFPARSWPGKAVGTDHGRTGDGQTPGARSRSPVACRWTSRTTRPCASAMKPSIKRCSFKVEARCAAN